MKDGFVKVAAADIDVRVGDCEHNGKQILRRIKEASARGVKVLVLPELCITGATCGDLFRQTTLLDYAQKCVWKLAEATLIHEMLVVVGAPLRKDGKLYDCAVVLYGGDVIGVVPRRRIRADLRRWFEEGPCGTDEIAVGSRTRAFGIDLIFASENTEGFKLGVEVGEHVKGDGEFVVRAALDGALIVVNPFALPQSEALAETLGMQSRYLSDQACCALICAGASGESTTDAVYGGHKYIAECGDVLAACDAFDDRTLITDVDLEAIRAERMRSEGFRPSGKGAIVGFDLRPIVTELDRHVGKTPFLPEDEGARRIACARILQTQAQGLAKRAAHVNAKKMIVGISGGLDSALAMIVSALALDILEKPREDLIAITMPCFGTTGRTRRNAELLAAGLRAEFQEIPIAEAVQLHLDAIAQPQGLRDAAYENAQARERTQVLMDYANRMGGLAIGTGDMSELALGWATYNGDHMSMYGVNAGLPKTSVRAVTAFYADLCDEMLSGALRDILNTPISPELLPPEEDRITQQTEDLVGPYELHDFFLYYVLGYAFSPRKILRLALKAFEGTYDRETILHWLKTFYRRFVSQQFKRSCMPDGAAVGSLSLSPRGGLVMPSDASANLWIKEVERLQAAGERK